MAESPSGGVKSECVAPNHKVWVHLSSGAVAGMLEHVVMFPFDSVKTRIQSLLPSPETNCPTPIHGVASMIKREGWMKPLRGVNAIAVGSLPAHALYFTAYEKLKNFLISKNTSGKSNTLCYGLSSVCATVLHDFVMNPVEVVKQRMQMFNSPFGGCMECTRHVCRTEGLAAFYRSYPTQLAMNIPFQMIIFVSYEMFQEVTFIEFISYFFRS
jgi:solute carrier family 25 iron transporter 28/37